MITLQDLTKIYKTPSGEVTAVNKVSMEIPSGKICILLGPSGCGKTTTLKMINRIIPITSGKVYMNGEDTDNFDVVSLRRKIGYVIQQIGLFPNMTIEENVLIVPKLLKWDKAKMKERARELMNMVGLDPTLYLKRFPRELSGGQQQRIGVIRALASDPPVMLMDEPFGAIDPINRAVIQDEFLKMQSVLKKTILFVSHDIKEAVKMADIIAMFKDGSLVQFNTPDAILAKPSDDFVEGFVGNDRHLKRLLLFQVKEAMDPMATVSESTSIQDAVKEMQNHDYTSIVVTDSNKHPLGYVKLNDLLQSKKDTLKQNLIVLPDTISIDDNLHNTVSKFYAHNVNWLTCLDSNGNVAGSVNQQGIIRLMGSVTHTL